MGISKKRGQSLLVAAMILALASLGAFFGFRRSEVAIPVQTEKVVRRDITELVVANGRIQPVVQVVINPEVSGEIICLPVKEGQPVKKGDLLVRIKPDNYVAQRNSAEANYKSAVAGVSLAKANLEKARLEYRRFEELFQTRLVSDSQFLEAKTLLDVAAATFDSSSHQCEQAKATLARAEDDLSKTTIVAPIDGTVTKLRSQQGERVVGTAMMAGTEIMTIANLGNMEARVDIGEIDIVLIQVGQKAHLEVEAFRDKKFSGSVTEIANAARGSASATQAQTTSQEATRFEVKILITEKEPFRPGMSVTAEIETRSKSNVLAVPIMAVTTRTKKEEPKKKESEQASAPASKVKKEEPKRADEIVFLTEGDVVKSTVVKTGISDDTHIEVVSGLTEGQEIVSGGYAAVSRQLEDKKKIRKEDPNAKKKADATKG